MLKIIRYCFNCKTRLYFNNFSSVNKHLSKERIEELWNGKNIKFFCCNCFGKKLEDEGIKGLITELKKIIKNSNEKDLWKWIEKQGKKLDLSIAKYLLRVIKFFKKFEDETGKDILQMNESEIEEGILKHINKALDYKEVFSAFQVKDNHLN